MMSRRLFVKQMLTILTFMSGGALTASHVWNRSSTTEAEVTPQEAQTSSREAQSASANPTPLLSFFLLSDLHISAADSVFDGRLHLALKDVSKFDSPVDTIVLGGDLTDFGRDVEYKKLQSILSEYKLPPLYANMGNHDYYDIWLNAKGAFSTETMPNGKTDAMSRERFMRFIGYDNKPYHEVWIKDVHLIMLSQETYVQEKPEVGEGAWYSDEQLAWFEETMKAHKDGRPAFVFIHQPLPEPGTDGGTHRLIRAKRFRAILEPYSNVFVLSGHSHRNFVGEDHYNRQNTFHWFNNASVGKTRAKSGGQGTPVQGMYIQLFPHEVVIRGREFSNRTWIEGAKWKIPLLPGHLS